jgi:hypothetical protein
VARRMGFIPFPLGVVLVKALYHALSFQNLGSIILFLLGFVFLLSCRILNTICTLGKACDIMQKHQEEKNLANTTSTNKKFVKSQRVDSSCSPFHQNLLPKVNTVPDLKVVKRLSNSSSSDENIKIDNSLGATALFSNSDVDLEDVQLNDKVLKQEDDEDLKKDEEMTRSEPDLKAPPEEQILKNESDEISHRTHKRSESEPSIQLETANK